MIKTVEVKHKKPYRQAVKKEGWAGVTSSGLLKVVVERKGKIVRVSFVKACEKEVFYVEKGSVLVIENLAFFSPLSVYIG